MSKTLKRFPVIVLSIIISNASQKTPINKTPKIISKITFQEISLILKNQIRAKPSHNPPKNASAYQNTILTNTNKTSWLNNLTKR